MQFKKQIFMILIFLLVNTMLYASVPLKEKGVPIVNGEIIFFIPQMILANPPTLSVTPTNTEENQISVEVNGEAGLKVYVDGAYAGTIGSNGKVTITLNTSGNAGIMTFSIGLKDTDGHESDTLSLSIEKTETPSCITLDELKTKIANGDDVTEVNTSCITDMSELFSGNTNFNQDISRWDVSNVANMRDMFFLASSFNQPIGSWDVSNVQRMEAMFRGASSFNKDISEWNVSNVISMNSMFNNASSFNQNIENWDVSNVVNMRWMFWDAIAFNQPIGDWDVSNVKLMDSMFEEANNFNQFIGDWNVSSVTNMGAMFYEATNFDQDISEWDVSNVTDHDSFETGSALQDSHNPFKISCITRVELDNMIANGEDVTQVNTSCITDMSYLFKNKTDFNQDISGWDVSNVTTMEEMFHNAHAFNQDIGGWDVSNVTNMQDMFAMTGSGGDGAMHFNQDISDWDVSSVTNMQDMFAGSRAFHQPIGKWDVSSVTNMYRMFASCLTFNEDLSDWDVSSVTDMGGMFASAREFNQDISDWNVSSVTRMNEMFQRAYKFNQPIGKWDVSNVTTIYKMFSKAKNFNQPIGDWNVSSVTHSWGMFEMFENATSFDQDISSWDISNVVDMQGMFKNVKLSTVNYDTLLLEWSKLPVQHDVTFDGGKSQYSLESGQAPRQKLIDDEGWIITDYGTSNQQKPVSENQNIRIVGNSKGRNIQLRATDANHDTLTYRVVSNPSHGTLTGEAPALVYVPEDAYVGEDSFTFVANDGTEDSNIATVNITIVPIVENIDSDNDHIPDQIELLLGTDIHNDDVNNNGIADGLESTGAYGDQFFDKLWHIRSLGTVINPAQQVPTIIGNDLNLLGVYNKYMGYNHGNPVIVQVVDDGVDADHEDLMDNMDLSRSYQHRSLSEFSKGDPSARKSSSNMHGTMVSGIIGARAFNGKGVRGIAPFAKIAGTNWLEYSSMLGLSFDWYEGDGANEIAISSNSWGAASIDPDRYTGYEDILKLGTSNLRNGKGRIYVKSAGNSRKEGANANLYYLNNNRFMINVAALRHDNKYSSYSSPGGNLLTSSYAGDRTRNSPTIGTTSIMGEDGDRSTWEEDVNNNYTYDMSGTSAAAPGVSGVLALVLEACPSLTWRESKYLVAKHGIRVDTDNDSWVQNSADLWHSPDYGYGLINAEGMINDCTNNNVSLPAERTAEASGTVDVVIADGEFATIGGLNISENMTIEWVEVTVDSDHANASDYRVELISPAGTVSRIVDPTKATGAWMQNGFRLGAAGFIGEPSQGEWKVKISDIDYEANTLSGSIHSLKIKVYGH